MTTIEWTDVTWNPVIGCQHIAEGCRNCYAETMSKRLAAMGQADYAQVLNEQGRFNGKAIPRPEKLAEPLKWRKPRMVFVNSMSDLFHKDVPFEFIAAVYGVMAACPQHTFQILTKRPERMLEFMQWAESGIPGRHAVETIAYYAELNGAQIPRVTFPGGSMPKYGGQWPLPNVWHGVSVAEQKDADRNIPILLQVPSAIRFVSAEPLLGPVDVSRFVHKSWSLHLRLDIEGALANKGFKGFTHEGKPAKPAQVEADLRRRLAAGERYLPMGDCDGFSTQTGCPGHLEPSIDWVIVGGESGPGARPCDVAWIRSIVAQCKAAGVACFVKQLGARPYQSPSHEGGTGYELPTNDRKGGNPERWPEDLRVRQWPEMAHG